MRTRFVVVVAALVAAAACATVAHSGVTRTLEKGDTFSVKGQSGRLPGKTTNAVGVVKVVGRWNGGTWRYIATAHTDTAGRYHFIVKPDRRGRLELRITPPDRFIQKIVLHVV